MAGQHHKSTTILIWHVMSFDLEGILPYIDPADADAHAPGAERPGNIAGIITSDSIHRGNSGELSPLGIPRVSQVRHRFYSQAIEELERQYRALDLPLIQCRISIAEHLLSRDSRDLPGVLYVPTPRGSEEREDLNALKRTLSGMPHAPRLRLIPPNTLICPDDLPFEIEAMPRTFSAFRRRIEKRDYREYRFAASPMPDRRAPGTGSARVEYYLFASDRIARYKETRNGLGSGDYSSRFSPWLAIDALRASEVGRRILDYEQERVKNESTYWLIFELLWRDFFYYLFLAVGDAMFTPRGFKGVQSPGLDEAWRSDPGVWTRFRNWAYGESGQDFIDAIMRELYATGESSNRARQCAASYLIHDLKCPWWWGAWWFEHCLIDYDPLSNWGNWAYIAGVGADPKPVRHFNIPKQAATHDPRGIYRTWVKEQGWRVPADALPDQAPKEAMR
jgi:deoxyribodipyrimidine photo-lyase